MHNIMGLSGKISIIMKYYTVIILFHIKSLNVYMYVCMFVCAGRPIMSQCN